MFKHGYIGDIILKKIKEIVITRCKIRLIPRSLAVTNIDESLGAMEVLTKISAVPFCFNLFELGIHIFLDSFGNHNFIMYYRILIKHICIK